MVAGPQSGRIQPGKLGIFLFIAVEGMFFAGLISAFLVFRVSATQWPPEGQPRLPIPMTLLNTGLLLLSGVLFQIAFQALKRSKRNIFMNLLVATGLLGALFLSIQGVEWVKLVKFGLTANANIFGGFFYALIGMHGLHVAGGLMALIWVIVRAKSGVYDPKNNMGVDICRIYWLFVVGLWPILFALVYL